VETEFWPRRQRWRYKYLDMAEVDVENLEKFLGI